MKESERRLAAALERRDQIFQDMTEEKNKLDKVRFIVQCVHVGLARKPGHCRQSSVNVCCAAT